MYEQRTNNGKDDGNYQMTEKKNEIISQSIIHPLMNQLLNQFLHQSINQSINQSIKPRSMSLDARSVPPFLCLFVTLLYKLAPN